MFTLRSSRKGRVSRALHTAFIALGGNLADVRTTLHAALEPLGGVGQVVRKSSLYRTAPWGKLEQPDFLNAALELRTALEPEEVLGALLEIERLFGRERGERWGPRTLDLDLLSYGGQVLETQELTLPHARMLERAFVLVPLLEIAPHWNHPATGESAKDALEKLDSSGIEKTLLEW